MEPQISSRRLPYRDLNIRSRSAGGYDVASNANPNKNMGPYSGVPAGNYTMHELPQGEDRTANNLFALSQNRELAERGEAMQEADRREAYERNPFSTQGIKTVERDPRWQALFQAMFEAGSAPNRGNWGSVKQQADYINPTDMALLNAMRGGR